MSFWYFGRDGGGRRNLDSIGDHLPALVLFLLVVVAVLLFASRLS
jgi:hypothetical protein